MKRRKIALMYNPVSGQAKFKYKLDEITKICQRNGAVLIPYRTEKENPELPDFLRDVEPDGVIAAGGDGTLHQAIDILLQNNIDRPIGIIGSGTSNDFATYLGVHNRLEEYVGKIAAGTAGIRAVDAGCANGRYFINVASAGMLTGVSHKVNTKLKNTFGKLAYYAGGLKEITKLKPLPLTIEAGGRIYQEDTFLFVIINSDAVGSFRHVAKDVAVDDGLLDLLLVRWSNPAELFSLTASLAGGRGIGNAKNVVHIKSDRFVIAADSDGVESDLDGEVGPELPLTVTAEAGALKFFCL